MTCNTNEDLMHSYKVQSANLNGRDHLVHIGLDCRTILKWLEILRKRLD
jgi:aryl carrier-like protein